MSDTLGHAEIRPLPWTMGSIEHGTVVSANGYVIHRQGALNAQFTIGELEHIVKAVNYYNERK